jgi:flagellar motor switch protein FliG
VQRMAEVLRSTEKKLQKEMLKTLMDQDADMTARIQKLLFRFEDLTEMDDTQVRAVLGKVETSTIATALYQADQKILDKVMGNLSKRARETLEEELSFLSRVPETQIKTARETVGEAIAEVEMESE